MAFSDILHRRRLAYIRTFCGDSGKPLPEAERVLADLKRFCGINRGGIVVSPVTRNVDPYASIYRAGMRDVYLRIAKFLELTEETELTEDHDRPDTAIND
jgi:hypothetical protein